MGKYVGLMQNAFAWSDINLLVWMQSCKYYRTWSKMLGWLFQRNTIVVKFYMRKYGIDGLEFWTWHYFNSQRLEFSIWVFVVLFVGHVGRCEYHHQSPFFNWVLQTVLQRVVCRLSHFFLPQGSCSNHFFTDFHYVQSWIQSNLTVSLLMFSFSAVF
jgi:hypothetical protein